jgi:hypothetical protein
MIRQRSTQMLSRSHRQDTLLLLLFHLLANHVVLYDEFRASSGNEKNEEEMQMRLRNLVKKGQSGEVSHNPLAIII